MFPYSKFSPRAAVGQPYKSRRGFPEPCLQYTQLPDFVFPMLSKLGAYLAIDPILHVKVGRIAKGFLKEVGEIDLKSYNVTVYILVCK